jgi:membrane protein implicated in regulation of membrane protease activity
MMVIGLILLVIALVVGLVGVLTNLGAGAAMTGGFSFFGLPVEGSTGQLFLFGIIVGAIGMLGVGMVFGALGRRQAARRELRDSRREAADLRRQHDQLARDLEQERAQRATTASAPAPAPAPETTSAPDTSARPESTGTSEPTTSDEAEARPPAQRESSDQPARLRDRLRPGKGSPE